MHFVVIIIEGDFYLINSVLEAVGNVPLVRLKKMSSGNVLVKAKFLNPGGSIKDRVAKQVALRFHLIVNYVKVIDSKPR